MFDKKETKQMFTPKFVAFWIIVFFLLLVTVLSSSAQNLTNTTLNMSILPGTRQEGNVSTNNTLFLFYNVSAVSCNNTNVTSICSVSRDLGFGDGYSLHSGSCDIDFSCESLTRTKCLDLTGDNYTFPVTMGVERRNDTICYIYEGEEECFPEIAKFTYFEFTETLSCPDFKELLVGENLSFEQCSKYIPYFIGEDWLTTNFELWTTGMTTQGEAVKNLTDQLAICLSEKEACHQGREAQKCAVDQGDMDECSDEKRDIKIRYDIVWWFLVIETVGLIACIILLVVWGFKYVKPKKM